MPKIQFIAIFDNNLAKLNLSLIQNTEYISLHANLFRNNQLIFFQFFL